MVLLKMVFLKIYEGEKVILIILKGLGLLDSLRMNWEYYKYRLVVQG